MSVLLHLSDPHFGTEQAPVVEALVRLVRQRRPAVGVLSGDLTQRATAVQFAAARTFVDRLGIPAWAAVPGNHDIPLFDVATRVLRPYGRYRAAFGGDLEPRVATSDWLVLTHNTTRRWRHANGEISSAQIDRTARALESAARRDPRQIRVVVVHQPVAVQRVADEKDVLRGADAAVRRWAAAGADIVLGGHIHLPYALPLQTREPLARPLWAVQAGTAVSSRVREGVPNSVNLLAADTAGGLRRCRWERWDYAAGQDAFVQAHAQDLDLAPALWAPPSAAVRSR